MSLSERLIEATVQARVRTCKLGDLLRNPSLEEPARNTLITLLAVPKDTPGRVSNTGLGKVLRSEGFPITDSAVDRHRRGSCLCTLKVGSK